jgi:uncharacterized protein
MSCHLNISLFLENTMNPSSISRAAQAFAIAATLTFTSYVVAEPSRLEVEQALKAGNIAKAESMMKEVVAAHPESAKGHFKYSEILAKEGRIAEAKTELSHAEQIQPGLAFATPEAVAALNHKLYGTTHASKSSTASPLMFWGGIALIGLLIAMAFRAFRRPQVQPAYGPQGGYPQGNYPQAGGYPQGNYPPGNYGPQGGGMGSGIMGGLATGAAVGAGIVAGEVLMHKMLDDDHPNAADYTTRNQPAPDNYNDISGSDFVDNDNGSWDNDSSFDGGDSGGDWS